MRDRRIHSESGPTRQGGHGAAALRDVPGVSEVASLAGPCDVVAPARARDIGELAGLVAARVRAAGGVMLAMSCPAVHCRRPIAVDHHTTIHEVSEGGVQAVCSCGWRSPVFGADKTAGTMDPLQRAADAGDLHEWEMSLP